MNSLHTASAVTAVNRGNKLQSMKCLYSVTIPACTDGTGQHTQTTRRIHYIYPVIEMFPHIYARSKQAETGASATAHLPFDVRDAIHDIFEELYDSMR